jgi:hypothetical protein
MIVNLVSDKEVISVVSAGTVHTVTIRVRRTGEVTTQVFYGQLPAWVTRRM